MRFVSSTVERTRTGGRGSYDQTRAMSARGSNFGSTQTDQGNRHLLKLGTLRDQTHIIRRILPICLPLLLDHS